jgi:hypothetical protein
MMTALAATRAARQQQQDPECNAAGQQACVCRSRSKLLLGHLQHLLLLQLVAASGSARILRPISQAR